ncbi:DUF4189 domain-containing protein [Hoeflea sp. YIM 152468]|uniref:DUF4189 domain-containing protein n=1 Tax=Hoeflea sp. YIM 152468 TaxID=3031759 RepID=UPI0023DC3B12|nr:DUF4189 domain-containing protein [Hoeflea sp. YIM 152468]MDF1607625.1 DUF4189 domain-containing protein [Hoeflea sp. YIM 152468]
MKASGKLLLAGLCAAIVAVSSASPALAWGCIALASDGTYGYSYDYEYEEDAIERALNECARLTPSNDTCYIEECDPDE